MIRVHYSGSGPGGIYVMTPTSTKAARRMRKLCPGAIWMGSSMYVEQRFAMDVAVALQERGERLLHGPTGRRLNTFTGVFTVDAGEVGR